MKTALVYDHINKIGGAEQILQTLHELYPSSPWFTSLYNPQTTPFTKGWQIHSSRLNQLPFLRNHHELIPFLTPYVFENFDFSDFDLVLSTSSAGAKGILTKPQTLHINYCLTPTRYLWSHKQAYLNDSQFRFFKKLSLPLIKAIFKKLKKWDLVAASRPDHLITISEHVKKRVKKYYKRDSDVIYPPVDTKRFKKKLAPPPHQNYFLTVARLVPYKKLALLLEVFQDLDQQLVIIGTGSQEKLLKRKASSNIHFLGQVEENTLIRYYQHAQAFLQANEEDFGIVMVEAQAAGKPVIAYAKGGAQEIVKHQKTGILVQKQSRAAFLQAIKKYATIGNCVNACRENAKRFDKTIFKNKFKNKVEELWENHQNQK